MEYYQHEFIKNLKKYRQNEKLSQAKLSELCNVSTGTIGNIECGSSKPSFDLILRIADVLHVHPAMLFSGKSIEGNNSKESELDKALLIEFYTKLKEHLKDRS